MIWRLEDLMKSATSVSTLPARGKGWVPARPDVSGDSVQSRVRGAWGVLTGRLDAVRWPAGQ